jgi:hypothetical protein
VKLFKIYLESTSRTRDQLVLRVKHSRSFVIQDSLAELGARAGRYNVCDGGPNIARELGMMGVEQLELNYSFLVIHVLQVLTSKEPLGALVLKVFGVSADLFDPRNSGPRL